MSPQTHLMRDRGKDKPGWEKGSGIWEEWWTNVFCYFCFFFFFFKIPKKTRERKAQKRLCLLLQVTLNWGVLSRQKEGRRKKGEITMLWWEKCLLNLESYNMGNWGWWSWHLGAVIFTVSDFSQFHSAQRCRNGRGKVWAPWGRWDGRLTREGLRISVRKYWIRLSQMSDFYTSPSIFLLYQLS